MIERISAVVLLAALAAAPANAQKEAQKDAPALIQATTASGEKVVLHPNGRWWYVDTAKAEEAKKVADTFPENHTRPIDAQGCMFGFGRCIMPGDKDYNRGSLGHR